MVGSPFDGVATRLAQRHLESRGLKAVPAGKAPSVLHADLWELVRPHTMTDSARVDALYEAVRQVVRLGIPGDLVECGVYRGGCSMAMAMALLDEESESGATPHASDRSIWLYDTFAGMTRPTDLDVRLHDGTDAIGRFQATATGENSSDWCAADLATVSDNMRSTGLPEGRAEYIVGPVEETLRTRVPDRIALLRLDTDWYASTRVELEVLVPRLSPGGVLIVDDYHHWSGSRRAVDEYFDRLPRRPILFPVGKGSVMTTIG